jgi:hypothetical protein
MVSVPRITVDDIAVPLMSKGTDEEKQEHLHSIRYIKDKVEKYVQKTFVDIGAASTRETFALLEGLRHIKDAKDIADWMLYVDGEMQRQQEFAVTLQRTLDDTIRDAVSRGFITNDSALKWKSRFTNRDVGYKEKEQFILKKLPKFKENWEEVHSERKTLLALPSFASVTSSDVAQLAVFKDDNAFKALHYDEKKHLVGLIAALLNAREHGMEDLFTTAKEKLLDAEALHAIAGHKVGQWLDRIFKTKQSRAAIEKFVLGTGANSLSSLIDNWRSIAQRYANVQKKFREKGDVGRGFTLVSESEFLSMHYAQRLSYVKEAEQILRGEDTDNEHPTLLKIRHYLDLRDWESADEAIQEAKKTALSTAQKERLASMELYLEHHRDDGFAAEKNPERDRMAMKAIMEIQEVMQGGELDEGMKSLLWKLMPYGNMAINQLRWTLYNYKWCNQRGFVDQKRARKRIEDNRESTKKKYENGEDIGMVDEEEVKKKKKALEKASGKEVTTLSLYEDDSVKMFGDLLMNHLRKTA